MIARTLWNTASGTLRALLEPGRAVAISAVVVPLLYAQAVYNKDGLDGVLAGLSLSIAAVFVAPVAYRLLVCSLRGLLAYLGVGVISVLLAAIVLPRWFHFEDRFLTLPETLPLVYGLWVVAGWGLGRDVSAEDALAAAARRERELTLAKEHAELLAIRAHLDPHFLFNTLNAIAEWCSRDPVVAEAALLQLARVLRTVLGAVSTPTWPLSDEIALCREVLSLHCIRDPERFAFSIEDTRASEDETLVPTLLLLPIVENAVKHGPARGHEGKVEIIVGRTGSQVTVIVRNPGPFGGERAGGQGLQMVRTRLRTCGEGTLKIETDGTKTEVRVAIC